MRRFRIRGLRLERLAEGRDGVGAHLGGAAFDGVRLVLDRRTVAGSQRIPELRQRSAVSIRKTVSTSCTRSL